jgi:TIR domain
MLVTTKMNVSDYVSPKVFISYSWTSDEYADGVKSLAEKLLSNGIDVVLDRWDLKPGQDKFVFMEQMVTNPEIKKVLVMCDKRYVERADSREGGVGTESTIISQEVYNQVNQEKFIPVVTERGPDGEAYLPAFIKSRIYIDILDPRCGMSGRSS